MRTEQTIFDELAKVCSSPGYIHAIAYLSFRDSMIHFSGEMKPDDMLHLFSKNRLIRSETSTLVGLLIKNDINIELPPPPVLQEYIDKTEALLEEIHQSMTAAFKTRSNFEPENGANEDVNPFTTGIVLREPIFYGGESAYSFQYRDLSPKKYVRDNDWLIANKHFSIKDARDVVQAIGRMLDDKLSSTLKAMQGKPPDQWTFLPGYTFTGKEVAGFAMLDFFTVQNVLNGFALSKGERNTRFTALHDFNVANALPLIPLTDGNYALFNIYSLAEALYESPFYWMGADKTYVSTAMRNRGLFTEEFSVECLVRVFGVDKVYPNIDIFETKEKKVGEIDVLVLFGNRAIVLQAKSKRLTIEARKGNDGQIKDDFKKSIQDSYDQAYKCAQMLHDGKYTLRDRDSNEIIVPIPIKDVYILCVVSDHYPALSFQVRQYLEFHIAQGISPPFVLDVFTLDAMTEMLESPLLLISYIDRRTKYIEKLVASHELTVLSYHLKQNLWLSDEYDMVMLEDEISTDLDLAMLARRESVPAKKTPDGILTRFTETTLGHFVKEIESRPDPGTIDLGLMLLTLSEETIVEISKGIKEIAKRARADGISHDLTFGIENGEVGLTIHCNNDPIEMAGLSLQRHCHARKYTERANAWFGICITPNNASLRFGLNLDYPWEQNEQMDALTKSMTNSGNLSSILNQSTQSAGKVRRNGPCPCGSGKKFKKCCFLR